MGGAGVLVGVRVGARVGVGVGSGVGVDVGKIVSVGVGVSVGCGNHGLHEANVMTSIDSSIAVGKFFIDDLLLPDMI